MDDESPAILVFDTNWVSEAAVAICLRLGWKCGTLIRPHRKVSFTIATPKGGPYHIDMTQEGIEAIKTKFVGTDAHGTAEDEQSALRTVFDFVLWAEIDAVTGGK